MVGSTIANIDDPNLVKRRARRPYMPKTRTGCVTCKIRRVKCDEGKPSCARCISTGRKCDGYSILPAKSWRLGVADQDHTLDAASMQPWASTLLHFGDPKERRALQFFLERTASTLSGYVGSYFWSSLLPQASHSQPALKHILIATASVHEYLHADYAHLYDRRFIDEHYNSAIASITRPNKAPALEIVLMACLLFTCCEFLRGHFKASIMHIEGGLKIMQDWRKGLLADPRAEKRRLVNSTKSASSMIQDRIGPILASFAAKAALYGVCQDEVYRYEVATFGRPVVPIQMHDLHEASHCLSGIIQWLIYAMEHPKNQFRSRPADQPGIREVQTLLEEWSGAFEAFEARSHFVNEQAQETAQHLRIHVHAATIVVNCFPSASEMVYDDYIDSFRFIVEQSKGALTPRNPVVAIHSHSETHDKHTFNLGLIPPLFLTASRCRDPTIRREALDLLRALNRVEGLWDSCTASEIAETIIRVEERNLALVSSQRDVTEDSRIRVDKVALDPEDSQKVFLYYKRSPSPIFADTQDVTLLLREKLLWRTCDHTEAIQWPLQTLLRIIGFQGLVRSIPAHSAMSDDITKLRHPANKNSTSVSVGKDGTTADPMSLISNDAPRLFWCPSVFGAKSPPEVPSFPSSSSRTASSSTTAPPPGIASSTSSASPLPLLKDPQSPLR